MYKYLKILYLKAVSYTTDHKRRKSVHLKDRTAVMQYTKSVRTEQKRDHNQGKKMTLN